MKKIISVFLLVFAVSFVFVGCKKTEKVEEPAVTEEKADEAATEKPVEEKAEEKK